MHATSAYKKEKKNYSHIYVSMVKILPCRNLCRLLSEQGDWRQGFGAERCRCCIYFIRVQAVCCISFQLLIKFCLPWRGKKFKKKKEKRGKIKKIQWGLPVYWSDSLLHNNGIIYGKLPMHRWFRGGKAWFCFKGATWGRVPIPTFTVGVWVPCKLGTQKRGKSQEFFFFFLFLLKLGPQEIAYTKSPKEKIHSHHKLFE